MIAYLRLLRAGTLFSPAADIVAGACLAGEPWSPAIVRGACASACIYAAGMVLNDHADREEDARQRPERPIPSGQVSAGTALGLGVALLAGGIALAPWTIYWSAIAVLVVLYDYAFKRSPVGGAITMGVLRAMNLLAGAMAVSHAAPDDRLIWIAAAVYGVYILAVTILGIFEDTPRVAPRAVIAVQTVPPVFAPLVLLALPERWPGAGIGLAMAILFGMHVRKQGNVWPQAAIRKSMMYLLLGTMCYTSLLCLGSGRTPEALGIAVALVLARRIARVISLT